MPKLLLDEKITNAIINEPFEENLIDISFGDITIPILTSTSFLTHIDYKLFNILRIKTRKKPIIKNNTFLLWEPCSQNHAEVVPGYAKYLLDLGYHVSVLITPQRYNEGLFSKFKNKNISYNIMTQKEIRKYFKSSDLNNIKGVLVTTVGKLCNEINYNNCYQYFAKNVDKSKLFFVEHEAKFAIDAKTWDENLITLRKLNYKGAKSVVVNPHYFGEIEITPKNKEITNFITIGAIRNKRKNNNRIIEAVANLHNKGIHNFKVTVIGKGKVKHLPKELQKYFDIKGRLNFSEMYEEIEKADFILTSYDEKNQAHQRYNTTGTSGNFQLVYGFLKPCLIIKSFAGINGFTEENSILYNSENEYSDAMRRAININQVDYLKLQENLSSYQKDLYKKSIENLKELING